MIFVVNAAFGQQNSLQNHTKAFTVLSYGNFTPASAFSTKRVLPANFCTQQLGFFCKQELKFETLTKIPFKFRLGSVSYCDWMEGKRGAGVIPSN